MVRAPSAEAQSSPTFNAPVVLTAPAFVENGVIPIRYSGDGDNVSPPLEWSEAPTGTESFVLTLVDPDVPFGKEVPVYGLMPPPQLKAHAYKFTLYALDVPALEGLSLESDHTDLTEAMAGYVLATATLTAHFGH